MGQVAIVFDYDGVDKESRGKLVSLAGQIKRGKAGYAKAVIEIGAAIHEAHEILAGNGRDGKFTGWIEGECGLERSSAYRYLNAFEAFNKCPTVGHFSAGALYLLSEKSAPEKARAAAIKRAEKGETISKSVAEEIINSFTVDVEKKCPTVGHLIHNSEPDNDLEQEETEKTEPEPTPDEPKQPSGGTTFDPSEWEQESVKDGLGEEVTGELRKPFELRQGVQEQRNKLVSIKSWLTSNINHPGAFALASAQQRIVIDIDNVDTELKFYAPFATCCYCQNKMPTVANCEACHGKGWVTKSIYDAAPKGMKRGKN